MNTSLNVPPSLEIDYQTQKNLSLSSYVLGGITALQLGLFIAFLTRPKGQTVKKIPTSLAPAEKLLILLGIDLIIVYVSNGFTYSQPPLVSLIAYAINAAASNGFSSIYIIFVYVRSQGMLEILYPDHHLYIGAFLKYICPFLGMIPVPVDAYSQWEFMYSMTLGSELSTISFCLNVVSASIICISDLFLLFSFVLFMFKTTSNSHIDNKFLIIAKFNSASSLIMLISYLIFIPYNYMTDLKVAAIVYLATQLGFLGISWTILLAMKVALVHEQYIHQASRQTDITNNDVTRNLKLTSE